MFRAFLLISIGLSLSACGQQIEDFVSNGSSPFNFFPIDPESNFKSVTVSPGSRYSKSDNYAAKLSLTTSGFQVKGQTVEAKISLNREKYE